MARSTPARIAPAVQALVGCALLALGFWIPFDFLSGAAFGGGSVMALAGVVRLRGAADRAPYEARR